MGKRIVLLLLLASVTLSGCAGPETQSGKERERINDNDGVYSLPKDDFMTLYLDITDNSEVPFYIASGKDRVNGEKVQFPLIMYEEEEITGGEKVPVTGVLQIKGNQAYKGYYRSFKITLDDEFLYKNQRIFLLYKCPEDPIRISMRLGMDLYALFDDIVSVRTGFAQVYMKAEGQSEYENYGLYTFTENPGGRYLRNHGLDRNGELYEIKDFSLICEKWAGANETEKDEYAEHKNGENPDKLNRLMEALTKTEDPGELYDYYFNKENYLTWTAASILLGNYKAGKENFLLYSPTDSEKWYFFPLPTDNILQRQERKSWSTPPDSYTGLGWFMESPVHYEFFREEENRNDLEKKIKELYQVLQEEDVAGICNEYKKTLAVFLSNNPEYGMLKYSVADTETKINQVPELIKANYEAALANLENPMPFTLYEPVLSEDGKHHRLSWQASISSSPVTYHIKISKDLAAEEVVFQMITQELSCIIEEELAGYYYIHITAENQNGTQVMNEYEKGQTASVWGVKRYEFHK